MCKALMCYAISMPVFQIIVWSYTFGIIPHMYPPAETIGPWFCFLVEYSFHYGLLHIGMFSLSVAAMKYLWIVHNDKMKLFGEAKAIALFLILHFGIPLVLSLLNLVSNGNKDHLYVVEQCWGNPVKARNEENGLLDYFCYYRQYEIKKYIGENAGNFFEPVLRATCGCLKIFNFLCMSNIIELFLYVYLCKHLNG